jgi:hypothetical protein
MLGAIPSPKEPSLSITRSWPPAVVMLIGLQVQSFGQQEIPLVSTVAALDGCSGQHPSDSLQDKFAQTRVDPGFRTPFQRPGSHHANAGRFDRDQSPRSGGAGQNRL